MVHADLRDPAIGQLVATLLDFRSRHGFGRAIAAPRVGLPPPALSELIQREIDHLDGVLMTERAEAGDAVRPIGERAALVDGPRAALGD